MEVHSRDTSPDPITLDFPHPQRRDRRAKIRTTPHNARISQTTPSKSIVFNTPQQKGTTPWQIKVTVEAEPSSGAQQSGITRTTTIPLQNEDGPIDRRPSRKRKGTPLNRQAKRQSPDLDDVGETTSSPPPMSPLRARRPQTSSRQQGSSQRAASTRSRRSNIPYDVLDSASQGAIEFSNDRFQSDEPGDMTVSANEDFSIVSLDSLQTAKDNSMSNLLQPIPEVDSSHLVPADSPRKVDYPDIGHQAAEARVILSTPRRRHKSSESNRRRDVKIDNRDEASLRRTTIDKAENTLSGDLSERLAVSQARTTVRIDSALDNEDIWQEEASRSLEETADLVEEQVVQESPARSERLEDLFADQPLRPARGKLPRTWRRNSAMDFSYVDSPARRNSVQHKRSGGSSDESGVLTPPSTEDEHGSDRPREPSLDVDTSELTQPDGEATHMHEDQQPHASNSADPDAADINDMTRSQTQDRTTRPDDLVSNVQRTDRTRPRPPRQSTVDLTELLNLDKSPAKRMQSGLSPRKVTTSVDLPHATMPPARHDSGTAAGNSMATLAKPNEHRYKHTLNTSLRRSLLYNNSTRMSLTRQSKHQQSQNIQQVAKPGNALAMRGATIAGHATDVTAMPELSRARSDHVDLPSHSSKSTVALAAGGALSKPVKTHVPQVPEMDSTNSMEDSANISWSYEEYLNLDSPRKIGVNFNDTSSHLFPHQNQTSLFDQPEAGPAQQMYNSSEDQVSANTSEFFITTKQYDANAESLEPGLLTRLAGTLWSALVRPTGPIWVENNVMAHSTSRQDRLAESFPVHVRTALRNRYGVCSSHHPWTMHHMRTLHRMLNSATTRSTTDTCIPQRGPLPIEFSNRIDTRQISVTGREFAFTRVHAFVIASFAEILVAPGVIAAMKRGEVEWLGDDLAARCRGLYDEKRHGDDLVWERGLQEKTAGGSSGEIVTDFMVHALGDVIWSDKYLDRDE